MATFGNPSLPVSHDQDHATSIALLERLGSRLGIWGDRWSPGVWMYLPRTRTMQVITLLLKADGPFVIAVACSDIRRQADWDCRPLLSELRRANERRAAGHYQLVTTRAGYSILSVVEIEVRPFGDVAFTASIRGMINDFESLLVCLQTKGVVGSYPRPTLRYWK